MDEKNKCPWKGVILAVICGLALCFSNSMTAYAYSMGQVPYQEGTGSPFFVNFTSGSDWYPVIRGNQSFVGSNSNNVQIAAYADIPLEFVVGWSSSENNPYPVSGYARYDFTVTSSYQSVGSPSGINNFVGLIDAESVTISDGIGGTCTATIYQRSASGFSLLIFFNSFSYQQLGNSTSLFSFVPTFRVRYNYQSLYKTDTEELVSSITNANLSCSYSSVSAVNKTGYNIKDVIVEAIDTNSVDIDTIVTLLASIDAGIDKGFDDLYLYMVSNNAFWQQLLNQVQNPTYYQNLQGHTFYEKVYTLLVRLQYILGGSDYDPNTDNATSLAQKAYNRWKQIILDAMSSVPVETEADTKIDEFNNLHESAHAQELEHYSQAQQDIEQINFSPSAPSGVENGARSIMPLVTYFYNSLGKLQFPITIALLVGLVSIVIGVINKFGGRGGGGEN